ncbi:GNAT family N-acetyltransferase [Pseudomonas cavernicola]|uniref:GNAT family N-acetyltransferase n=1 Tax=Pseudomonas cavernicola TaxID=2320866 RepID=A0A418XKP0_9PSED|nr:GNAT family N-acetyltransferase [Pseudomonas cavernicola]RJG13027.1 GNAT family N-acetyltransferase [Pseudomonas cavernicola]
MNNKINIRLSEHQDHEAVGILTWELLNELFPKCADQFEKSKFITTSRTLLSEGKRFWSLVAELNNEVVAILNINECAAIYTGGSFGEITEFYIKPSFRSKGIGARLIEAAKIFCAEKGWSALEVGAPPSDPWQRTIDFYLENGFSIIGPRLEATIKSL